jgi:RNA polymerase sigma-70 factor (ECF subfamily)
MTTDGFRQAVLDHKDRLHSYALWMVHDREEARDVTQEALVRLWQNRESVHAETARSWLLRTVHNLCVDRMRRKSTRNEVPSESVEAILVDGAAGPERVTAAHHLRDAIGRALTALSVRDRAIVLMREVHEMSYEEIAGAMDIPLGTLKSTLHRAREQLRRELTGAGVVP